VKLRVNWQGDVRFESKTGSGHTITTDGPEDAGGNNAGPRPMEMMLLGVGGCSAYDVVHILKRGRVEVSDCVAELEAERAPDPPRVFTRIKMHFRVSGPGISEKKVARAVKLSAEKYCSASIMLSRGGVAIEHSFEAIDTGVDSSAGSSS
jgi:putative redox protein